MSAVKVRVLLALTPDRLRSEPSCPVTVTVTVSVGSLESLTV